MSKDILFKTDDFVFSYRVGGILIHNNKILLQKPKNENFAIIGGHVSSFETSMDSLKREFKEELHVDIQVNHLMAIGEIFFPWGNKVCHQICFYYKVQLEDMNDIPLDDSFLGYDELDNQRIDLEYHWVPLDELRNGLLVYPLELIPYILEDNHEIKHFISIENKVNMFKYCNNKDDYISLHDCHATNASYKNGILSFVFHDGIWISKKIIDNKTDKWVRTNVAEVKFLLEHESESSISIYVFENKFNNIVRREWELSKLIEHINSKKCTLEFLYQYKGYNSMIIECCLWSNKKPYHKECELKLLLKDTKYYWNDVCDDQKL